LPRRGNLPNVSGGTPADSGCGREDRRVVLDYELKRNVYSELNRVEGGGGVPGEQRKRAMLKTMGWPSSTHELYFLTAELNTKRTTGRRSCDLELAFDHYKTGGVMQKHAAGLRIYGPACSFRSPALCDPEVVAGLISFLMSL
jgi:hypothetical protein